MSLCHDEMLAIVESRHGQPFRVLGSHEKHLDGQRTTVVRVFRPDTSRLWVVDAESGNVLAEAVCLDDRGFYEADLGDRPVRARYRLRALNHGGALTEFDDAYAFGPILSDLDLYLMREGTHYNLWEKLGAHPMVVDGVEGVHFAVWAPNALRVSVVGDFNCWDGRRHCMQLHERNGTWEIFVPGAAVGDIYKYEIKTREGHLLLKADPCACYTEMPPRTGSRVFRLAGFPWTDDAWMERRRSSTHLDEPIAVYEVHLGSWRHVPEESRSLSYREAGQQLAQYVRENGFTHVELLPILEHPFYGSWGYQTVSFFAPTSRFGTPHDLMAFVNTLHENGIGVILDWVPAHFPSDAHGLVCFDGTHLYEHADPRKGRHRDWDTLVFNYGRTEVWNFLLSNALYWLKEYHFDALRVDAVASMLYLDYSRQHGDWLPNKYGSKENIEAVEFLKFFNTLVHREYPGVLTIAEESTAWPAVSRPVCLGGLGFSLKWNMGWMHDVLEYFSKDPIYRRYHANTLTFSMLYAYAENFVLPFSHDEVVYGKQSMLSKMPGDEWQKRANLRALFGYMYGHPGKKHMFMGMEFGQWNEWYHNHSLDWHLLDYEPHRQLLQWVRDLNRLYRTEPALHQRDFSSDGFRWINCHDLDHAIYTFLRSANWEDQIVFTCNFTPVPRLNYRVGVPRPGWYAELLNSDAALYGGSNLGNNGGRWADPIPWQGFDWSLVLNMPPLATVVLKRTGG